MPILRTHRTQSVVAEHAVVAVGLKERLIGLLNRSFLDEGEALILPRCNSIHTWFMRCSIDVLFLKAWTIIKAVPRMAPFRMAWVLGADTVVELPSGVIERLDIKKGELLDMAGDSMGQPTAKKIDNSTLC